MKIFILIVMKIKNINYRIKEVYLGIRAEDIMPADNNLNTGFWSFKKILILLNH